MRENVHPPAIFSEPISVSKHFGQNKPAQYRLSVLSSALQMARRCQLELAATGRVSAETVAVIRKEVQNWP